MRLSSFLAVAGVLRRGDAELRDSRNNPAPLGVIVWWPTDWEM
jgi:hypothetical protein